MVRVQIVAANGCHSWPTHVLVAAFGLTVKTHEFVTKNNLRISLFLQQTLSVKYHILRAVGRKAAIGHGGREVSLLTNQETEVHYGEQEIRVQDLRLRL